MTIRCSEENASSICKKKTTSSCCLNSRQECSRIDSQSKHFDYSYPTKSSFQTSWLRSTIYIAVIYGCITISSGATVFKDECDPNDPTTCSFGATCMKERTTRTPYYRCVCPQLNCWDSGLLYDPICASDGRTERMFVNALCLMLEQCVKQRPLEPICNGVCDTKCKESMKLNMPHEHCPPTDHGFCQNGGFCIHHRTANISSCRCPKNFGGERCERKELPSKSDKGGKIECDKRNELLMIIAVTLLAVVLLAFTIYLWLRNRKSQEKVWNHCEKDETTPLRQDARSESIFSAKLATQTANGK